MNSNEFEMTLVTGGFYFVAPTLFVPGSDKDAEYLSADDMLKVIGADGDDISRCVRRRSEQANATTYYLKNWQGTQYWRVLCPNSTGSAGTRFLFILKQLIDVTKIRLGLW
jgi:hypothetical protein